VIMARQGNKLKKLCNEDIEVTGGKDVTSGSSFFNLQFCLAVLALIIALGEVRLNKMEAEQNLAQMEQLVVEAQSRVQKSEAEMRTFGSKVEELEVALSDMEKLAEGYNATNGNLQSIINRKSTELEEITLEYSSKVQKLEEEMEKYMKKVAELADEKSVLEVKVAGGMDNALKEKEELKSLEALIVTMKSEASSKEEEMKLLKHNLEGTINDKKQLMEAEAILKSKLELVSKDLIESTASVASLKKDNEALSNQIVEESNEMKATMEILNIEKDNCLRDLNVAHKSFQELADVVEKSKRSHDSKIDLGASESAKLGKTTK